MGSIASFNFLQMKGPGIPEPSAGIESLDRPWVDGSAWRAMATKGAEFELETYEGVANVIEANGTEESYKALIGQLVTVVDDLGQTKPNVLVQGVRVIRKQATLSPTDTAATYLVQAVWALKTMY
jgi:hypothetical protein